MKTRLDRLASGHVLAGSLLLTFAAMRSWLHVRPDTDLNVGPYNVHHLFTGVLILTVCGIPAILRGACVPGGRLPLAGFGAGLSMVLDEWFYLIVTDGSNAAYVRMPSLGGGALLVCGAAVYALRLGHGRVRMGAAQPSTSAERHDEDHAHRHVDRRPDRGLTGRTGAAGAVERPAAAGGQEGDARHRHPRVQAE